MRRHVYAAIVLAAVGSLLTAGSAAAVPDRTVTAVRETPALFDDEAGGEADGDDPAIWVDRTRPGRSLVLAAVKNAGLRVYDLGGRELQAITPPAAPGPDDEAGRFNNVDLVPGFRLGHRAVDLAVVTDRGRDHLRFYRVDPVARRLVDVTSPAVPFAFNDTQAEVNEQATAYGLATFTGTDGRGYAVVTRRHTATIGLFRLRTAGDKVTYERVDTYRFPDTFRLPDGRSWAPCASPGEGPQLEGLVVDPLTRMLYAAQEDVGLWRLPIVGSRFAGPARSVERTREFGVPATYHPDEDECIVDYAADPGYGGRIAADVEGLTFYRTTLVVSSQGNGTFYTYDRFSNRPRGHFAITDSTVDGVTDCDGAAAVSTPLPGFPGGLLVVHDGRNTPDEPGDDGEPRPNTNFKYLDAGFLAVADR